MKNACMPENIQQFQSQNKRYFLIMPTRFCEIYPFTKNTYFAFLL